MRQAQVDAHRIVVTPARVAELANAYALQFGAKPEAEALEALVLRDVHDEVLFRQAKATGLDADDEIVRRRLVQKMQFLLQDLHPPPPPGEAELRAFYDANPARYGQSSRTTFTHVFFSADAPGDARARAEAVMNSLPAGAARAPERGDPFPDLYDFAAYEPPQVYRLFGHTPFAEAVLSAPVGAWVGPFRSSYGWHLLRIGAREPAARAPFASVREAVRDDVLQARREAANKAAFDRLARDYRVVRQDRAGAMIRPALAFLMFWALLAGPAAAHEVRPALLEIRQTAAADYAVTWKQPAQGELALHLAPHLSTGWLERPPGQQYAAAGFLIRTWAVHDPRPAPLAGATVEVEGLKDTITDVLVRVRLTGRPGQDAILKPQAPRMTIAAAGGAGMAASAFLALGVQHILTGPDHLLFVLGLLLLVRDRWALLKTVSAFTLAHSLTLAAASFGLVRLPVPLLNALIALSILFLALEIVRQGRGGTSLTIRHPWVAAFAFGLLHGMGFASGLTSLGLDRMALVRALVLFNVGVEIGQLAFVGLVLALRRAFALMRIAWPRPLALAPTYAIGLMGAAWTFQYASAVAGGAG